MQWHERIRAQRIGLNLSQAELAVRSGVSQALINKIERGQIRSSKAIPEILRALDIPLSELELDGVVGIPKVGMFDVLLNRIPDPRKQAWADLPLLQSAAFSFIRDGRAVLKPKWVQEVPRPPQLAGIATAYAMYVEDGQMIPELDYGDTIFVHPTLAVSRGDTVIFRRALTEGEREQLSGLDEVDSIYVVRRLEGIGSDYFDVRAWGGSDDERSLRKLPRDVWISAHRVVSKAYR